MVRKEVFTVALMPRKPDNVVDFNDRRTSKEQVLEQLFNEHGPALRAFLAGRTRNEAEAEDLLQEVFVRLARIEDLTERLVEQRGNVRSFVFSTANRLAVDLERRKAVRRNYRVSECEQADKQAFEITPEVVLLANQELEMVKQAILALPPNWRKAFTLSRFRHMSYKQIACEMGVSVKVIEKYISRSLTELRNATRADRALESSHESLQ